MISDIALRNFNKIWRLFGNKEKGMLDAGGSNFLIEPFRQFFSSEFANSLTEESAHESFHLNMAKWGQIEQNEHETEIFEYMELPNGEKLPRTRFKDPSARWARTFIFSAFYNLCSISTNYNSIEELIYFAVKDKYVRDTDGEDISAFIKLIELSNSFLIAEWGQEIIHKAISNNNREFFAKFSKAIEKNSAREKFDTIKRWMGVVMLWYLGGRDIKPRKLFLNYLQQNGVIAKGTKHDSFQSMLSNLGLTKNLNLSK